MSCNNCNKIFTTSSRKEIKCLSCPFSICKSCISKRIIKNVSDYDCPSCHNFYTEEILKNILSRTTFNKWKKEQDKIEKIEVIGSGGFGECSLIRRIIIF